MNEPRYFIDAAGYVWRDFGPDGISMARVNPDNSPIPEPRTYLQPVVRHLAVAVGADGAGHILVTCSCAAAVFGRDYADAAENHLRHMEICAALFEAPTPPVASSPVGGEQHG